MVNITGITTTIDELDVLYNANPAQATYFSKLALLELCGWIEQTMDSVIKDYATSKLMEPGNLTFVQEQIIDPTYGFHYKRNFRPMLMSLIGIILLEKIETKLTVSGDLPVLTSQLGMLKQKRNQAAHTTITGVTPNYDAPSIIRSYLNRIHPVLTKIETELSLTGNINTPQSPGKGCLAILATITLVLFIFWLSLIAMP